MKYIFIKLIIKCRSLHPLCWMMPCAEYLEELKEYAPTYTLWSGSEEELAEPLKGMANSLDRCYQETEEQGRQLSDCLAPALHEYVLCSETLKVQHPLQGPHPFKHKQTGVLWGFFFPILAYCIVIVFYSLDFCSIFIVYIIIYFMPYILPACSLPPPVSFKHSKKSMKTNSLMYFSFHLVKNYKVVSKCSRGPSHSFSKNHW